MPPFGTLPLLGNSYGLLPGFPLLLLGSVSVLLYGDLLSGFVFGEYLFKLLGAFFLLSSLFLLVVVFVVVVVVVVFDWYLFTLLFTGVSVVVVFVWLYDLVFTYGLYVSYNFDGAIVLFLSDFVVVSELYGDLILLYCNFFTVVDDNIFGCICCEVFVAYSLTTVLSNGVLNLSWWVIDATLGFLFFLIFFVSWYS